MIKSFLPTHKPSPRIPKPEMNKWNTLFSKMPSPHLLHLIRKKMLFKWYKNLIISMTEDRFVCSVFWWLTTRLHCLQTFNSCWKQADSRSPSVLSRMASQFHFQSCWIQTMVYPPSSCFMKLCQAVNFATLLEQVLTSVVGVPEGCSQNCSDAKKEEKKCACDPSTASFSSEAALYVQLLFCNRDIPKMQLWSNEGAFGAAQ